ncbi:hypothetical protein GCM10017559_24000 [Streptosporangium longisporum]|uniref:Uncharacterized protein n=1 Tax=Streptosporangium longisporum TaxID=46187 RepID=A0ABN3XW01_9ACTN
MDGVSRRNDTPPADGTTPSPVFTESADPPSLPAVAGRDAAGATDGVARTASVASTAPHAATPPDLPLRTGRDQVPVRNTASPLLTLVHDLAGGLKIH